ncbi:hypothetical protein IBB75_10340 [Listeria welshimeri]|uniref:hypothetical protein n=1 Tax=Listeria welshimeri TaxID=1643 RepID=UPI0018891082|nr:hypothetical protein [Listeria welshimeri]MBF2684114.1 hypothetical protein [Listeria welshimeri]
MGYYLKTPLLIYNIISEIKVLLENIINQELKLYKGCNESLIKNGTWSIIGSIELVDEDIYAPDLAYYVEWLPKESVNRLAINRKEKTVIVEKEYYIYLVKKGTLSVLLINQSNFLNDIGTFVKLA